MAEDQMWAKKTITVLISYMMMLISLHAAPLKEGPEQDQQHNYKISRLKLEAPPALSEKVRLSFEDIAGEKHCVASVSSSLRKDEEIMISDLARPIMVHDGQVTYCGQVGEVYVDCEQSLIMHLLTGRLKGSQLWSKPLPAITDTYALVIKLEAKPYGIGISSFLETL